MKRLITIMIVAVFVLTIPIVVSASHDLQTSVDLGSITVIFSENSSFSAEEQEILAHRIVSNDTTGATTYNALCTLFGHKTTTESITVIEHCVSDTQPRCLESLNDVTACSRCDYVDIVEITSVYIYCCE